MSSTLPHTLPATRARSVLSEDGTRIAYDLYEGTGDTAILVVPGFWRTRRHPATLRLAELLRREGAPVAVCDLRGHGDSGGTFGFNRHEHNDIAAVLRDMLATTLSRRVILVGLSYGASIAVSATARHDLPVSALLLISPVARFTMLRPRLKPFDVRQHIAFSQALTPPRIEWRFFRRSERFEAAVDVQSVHVPICLIHVKNDWLVHHGHSQALFESAHEPREIHVLDIEGNFHADRIFTVASEVIEPIVERFLAKYRG